MFKKTLYYITHWESWHWFAKYVLIAPAWAWLCLKARTLWFFTPSNPSITFGGFAGETKREIYEQLPTGTWPVSAFISPKSNIDDVYQQMKEKGLGYPVIVKPDSGLMGFMFRRVDTADHLRQYHEVMEVDYIVQEYVDYPLEISVFYYRFPDQAKGSITGFLKKEFLEVHGDGKKTLLELIDEYPRVQFRIEEMKGKHASHLHDIIPHGERYCLSYALNLSRGGKLISLSHEKDEKLLAVFDALSHHSKFYYGRYDIRCQSIYDLKEGKNYSILEFNGCGAEPHHVYGDGNTLWQACSILVHHWNVMYRIARYHHHKGIPYWSHTKARAFYKEVGRHMKKLKALDVVFEFDKTLLAPPGDPGSKTGVYNHAKRIIRMSDDTRDPAIASFIQHVNDQAFPCLAAHSALTYDQLRFFVVDHMACPHHDAGILAFLYNFIDEVRQSVNSFFSAVVLFREPAIHSEEMFENFFWKRLQSLSDMDAVQHPYDARVDRDVNSPTFSFSLKEEAFYIIGLHPASSRKARRFSYPAMVFNAHLQFERLRDENHYAKMQDVVRKRDIAYSGSVNPMLTDFGTASETFQYTGRQYDPQWKCPLIIRHARPDHHSAT